MRTRLCLPFTLGWLGFLSCTQFAATSKRVLEVTTEQDIPAIYAAENGEAVITDLTAAGYPFDVLTYGRFVNMSLDDSDDHDVIILNGHTSPTPVTLVDSKCQQALQ